MFKEEDMYDMTKGFLTGLTESFEVSPEDVARFFHETYERLAPDYSYKTRKASAVPWSDVPENNKKLMIAVATQVIDRFMRNTDGDV